jgi:hypothetical protein
VQRCELLPQCWSLEPAGFMLVKYGQATPVVTILAHLAYGGIVGLFSGAPSR